MPNCPNCGKKMKLKQAIFVRYECQNCGYVRYANSLSEQKGLI